MMKVTMTAALLTALAAAPAFAQMSGNMGSDTMNDGARESQSPSGSAESGAMGQEQSQGAQETQLPATGSTGEQTGTSTEGGKEVIETEIPVTSSTSRPANIEAPDAQAE